MDREGRDDLFHLEGAMILVVQLSGGSVSRTTRDRLLSAAAGAAVTLAALWLALITAAAATVKLRT